MTYTVPIPLRESAQSMVVVVVSPLQPAQANACTLRGRSGKAGRLAGMRNVSGSPLEGGVALA